MKEIKVIGPRILVKVKKFKSEEVEKIEGSILYRAKADSEVATQETTNQTIGEVVSLGTTAFQRKDAFCNGEIMVKEGDKVHFSRYGAMRLNSISTEEHELWVLMDKDVLVVEGV